MTGRPFIERIVILGTGMAGYTVAREIRKLDKNRPLLLITADDGSFYSKPMLSNALSSGKTPEQLATAATRFADELGCEIITGERITRIDTEIKQVVSENGTWEYGSLVLALGANARRLPLSGAAAKDILSVNTLADYVRLRTSLQDAQRVVILGAGLIGCEFANDLAEAGYAVSIVDRAERPLAQFCSKAGSEHLRTALISLGVTWHLGQQINAVEHRQTDRKSGYHIHLGTGEILDADVVLSAVGLQPNTTLAVAAGLRVNQGIVVDSCLRTSARDIYAIGDCAEMDGRILSFVLPIMHGAKALASTLVSDTAQVVTYPPMLVIAKTPACPLVSCLPPATTVGHWQETRTEGGVEALFRDTAGDLLGFTLAGNATTERQRLLRELKVST